MQSKAEKKAAQAQRNRQTLNPDTIRAIRGKCRKIARCYNMDTQGDDFASWALIKILEGRSVSAYRLFVDYMREHYGRPKSRGKTSPSNAKRWAVAAPISFHEINSKTLQKAFLMADYKMPDEDKFEDLILRAVDSVNLSREERQAVLLHHREALPMKEVALYLNVSIPYAESLVKEALYRITRHSACLDELTGKK